MFIKNPLDNKCKLDDFEPCKFAAKDKPSDCRKQNITYQGKCMNCEQKGVDKIYDGETARNLYVRSKEHIDGMKNKKETNFMYKHKIKDHDGNEEVKFRWVVTGIFQKPMQRQLFEAVKID